MKTDAPQSRPDVRLIPAALLAVVWAVFLARGMGNLLIPPLAAAVLIYLLLPYSHRPWAGRTMLAAAVLGTVWLLARVQSVLWVVGLGLFTAYLLNPAVNWLVARRLRRDRAALYLFLIAFALLALVLYFMVPVFYQQAVSFFAELPGYVTTLWDRYGQRLQEISRQLPLNLPDIQHNLTQAAQKLASGAGHQLLALGRLLAFVLSILVLTPIVSYYFLKDLPKLRRGVLALMPEAGEPEVESLFGEMDVLIGAWLRGQLLDSAIVGILTIIALTVLGIPYGIFIGVMAGVLNMVPIVGYWISLSLALIVVLASGHGSGMLIGVLATFFGIQIVEQNFLSPRIIGQQTGLHPVAVLLALLVFSMLGGFAGTLLAIPATLFLRVFYRRYVKKRWRERRTETAGPA